METIYPGTTNLVDVSKVKDKVTVEYIDDATITASLLTTAEAAITGASNLSVDLYDNTTGSSVQYYGRIPSTVALTYSTRYILRVTATWVDGDGNTITRRVDIGCKTPALPV